MVRAFPSARVAGAYALLSLSVGTDAFQTFDNMFGAAPSCSNPQLSCHNTTAVANTCCFNSPGGLLLQTQFWDTNPVSGPSNSWTIHGLWPDLCSGSYQSNCDSNRAYTNITQILQAAGKSSLVNYMTTFWVDQNGQNEQFWEHEWGKHGTCISTLNPTCYGSSYTPGQEAVDFFTETTQLFQTRNTYQFLANAGITPDASKTYSVSAVQAALKAGHGADVVIQCTSGAIDQVYYPFNVRGSIQTGQFVPTSPPSGTSSSCSGSIKYLPKNGAPSVSISSSGPTPSSPASSVIGGSSVPFSSAPTFTTITTPASSAASAPASSAFPSSGGNGYSSAAPSGGYQPQSSRGGYYSQPSGGSYPGPSGSPAPYSYGGYASGGSSQPSQGFSGGGSGS